MATVHNAVINSVLCYMVSARNSYTENSILTTCLSFYSYEKIYDAKETLCGITGDTLLKRRGDNKAKADLMDIMEIFKRIDQQGGSLPKFLSDSHADMPPASGFEIISEHLLDLISEVAFLKEKLLEMNPGDSSRTSDHLTDVKEDIKDIKLLLINKSEPKTKNQVCNKDPRPSYYKTPRILVL